MEPTAALMILVPILMPIVKSYGVDPIHFGIIMILNLMIGLLTPPVGMVLYVLSSVSKVPFERIAKVVFPYVGDLDDACLSRADLLRADLVLFLPNLPVGNRQCRVDVRTGRAADAGRRGAGSDDSRPVCCDNRSRRRRWRLLRLSTPRLARIVHSRMPIRICRTPDGRHPDDCPTLRTPRSQGPSRSTTSLTRNALRSRRRSRSRRLRGARLLRCQARETTSSRSRSSPAGWVRASGAGFLRRALPGGGRRGALLSRPGICRTSSVRSGASPRNGSASATTRKIAIGSFESMCNPIAQAGS